MIQLERLRPSDLDALREQLSEVRVREQFLIGLKSFLDLTPVDGGADSDLIFMTGRELALADIWSAIPARVVATHLKNVPAKARELLFERAPTSFRVEVETLLNSRESTPSRQKRKMRQAPMFRGKRKKATSASGEKARVHSFGYIAATKLDRRQSLKGTTVIGVREERSDPAIKGLLVDEGFVPGFSVLDVTRETARANFPVAQKTK